MRVLGFESSCDETAIAVYDSEKGLLAHSLFSQVDLHALYGGVVPELAARDHVRRLIPLLKATLNEANIDLVSIDALAYTKGPGLVGALLVGAVFAKTLAWALQKRVLGVHHLEAHLMAAHLEKVKPCYPYLGLLVSGGHTLLVSVKRPGEYRVLGQSLDDAVGEAFDKVAKMLGLPYPGGPALERLAAEGDALRFNMPRPMIKQSDCNCSFSGLKTHVMQLVAQLKKSQSLNSNALADIAAGFQAAVGDCLQEKTRLAIEKSGCQRLVVAGGVSANEYIRKQLLSLEDSMGISVVFPNKMWCTDNAAMVALTGCWRLHKEWDSETGVSVQPRWPLTDLIASDLIDIL